MTRGSRRKLVPATAEGGLAAAEKTRRFAPMRDEVAAMMSAEGNDGGGS